jgi:cation transport ATPase
MVNNNTSSSNVSALRTAMKWGAIMGLTSIIISMLFYFITGKMENNWPQMVLNLLLIFVGFYFGCKEQRDELQNGFISLGKSFGTGMLISVFYGIIGAFFIYLFFKFGDSNLIEQTIEQAKEKMLDQGKSEEEIDMSIAMTRKFMTPGSMAFWGLFGTTLLSLIPSLIIAAIVKKEQPESGF